MSEKKMSRNEFLELKANELGIDIASSQFDPEVFFPTLKGGVDLIRWLLKKWERDADGIERDEIKPHKDRKAVILNCIERLKEHAKTKMLTNGWSELYGIGWKLRISSTDPALEVESVPSIAEKLKYPDLVEEQMVYRWKNQEVKQRLLAGDRIPGLQLKGGKSLNFDPHTVEEVNKDVTSG